MKVTTRFLGILLTVAMLLGMLPGFASALVVKDANFTKIATLPNTYNATQGMCTDGKYIYTFQSEQGNNAVAHFIRTTISFGANVVMKYTDDTSITNFIELGHGNDMACAVVDGVTYLYLTTMYHKAHSTYATHSIWKFKVSGNTLKKVANYDVVQGTTNRNFTGLTLYKQDEEKVILLGCLDNKFYQIDIPHDQPSGTISCKKAFNIDYSSSLSISGAPTYNYTNSNGTKLYLVQGMHYCNGRIYYLMTAGTSNTPRSKNYILVYDISDYPENTADRKPLVAESIYMTSSTYNYFMELESVAIYDGTMYFAANAGKSGYYEAYDFVGKLKTTFEMAPEYTVTFCDEAGTTLQSVTVKEGETAKYTGATPAKAYDEGNHYTFKEWLTSVGGAAATLTNVKGDMKVYAGFTPTAHSYTEKVTTAPSCSAEGSKTFTCSCGRTYTEAIAMTGHTPAVINTKEATCTAEGYTGDTVCSVCNATLETGNVIPTAPHTPVVDPGYAPTCTAPGLSDGSHCNICGEVLSAQTVLPIAPHQTKVVPGKAATCLGSGLTDGLVCEDCGIVVQQQTVIPRLGHDYSYVNNGDTHTGTCTRCSKTTTGAHNYADGSCICGASLAPETTVDEAIVIRHSLNLASDISINYAVTTSQLATYDSYYLECKIPVYENNIQTGTKTLTLQPELSGNYYYFRLNGLNAVSMNHEVKATLHMTKAGQPYTSKEDLYSIAAYAYSQLNTGSATESLKALCANLLRYGALTQVYKNYCTDNLPDAKLTPEQQAYLTDLNTVAFETVNRTLNDLTNPSVTWVGKSLLLDSKVTLRYIFDTSAYTGDPTALTLRVTYTDRTGKTVTTTLEAPQPYGTGTTRYSFDFDGLLAAELRSTVCVAVYDGNSQVSPTMEYSAGTYGNGKTGNLLAVCR
ncbi:MAG: hypothetical protein IKM59_00835, partial [Oscillospiraceae bacterium]|nr:hypothetical protein [Oscillospiraceae bacterium]